MQKIVYNKTNGLEVKLDASDICPVSGRWLIPSRCTEVEPPEKKDGFMVEFTDGKWRQVEILDEDEEQEKSNSFQPSDASAKSVREEIEELKARLDFLTAELERVEKR